MCGWILAYHTKSFFTCNEKVFQKIFHVLNFYFYNEVSENEIIESNKKQYEVILIFCPQTNGLIISLKESQNIQKFLNLKYDLINL